ncbi:MAG: cytochrome P450, partial [Gammaproteobacteria bacterium]
FSAKMGYEQTLGSMYPDTILLSDFDDHRPIRRMFQTAFKNSSMRNYMDILNPVIANRLEQFDQQKDVVFFPNIKQTLLDIASKVFIGLDDLSSKEASTLVKSFIDSSEGLLALIRKEIPGGKFKRGRDGIRYQHAFFRELIQERRGKQGTDTLTYLCNERDENGNLFPDDDIIKQAAFLLFAAHDTTTSTLCHMVMYTGKYKNWQERLRREAQALEKPMLAYDDLESRTDTDLVFHEALRLHPSVPMMARRTINECMLGGYTIPANTIIWVAPTYNHRMPEYWTNPDEFDPERFTPERAEHKNHSFCFMPFGGGAHKCIGMHFAGMIVKTFLHQMLLAYEWQVPAGYNPKHQVFPMPKQADDLPLRLVRR